MNKEVVKFAVQTFKTFEKDGKVSKKWVRLSNILKEKFGIELSGKQLRDKIQYELRKEQGFFFIVIFIYFVKKKKKKMRATTKK